jgi:hypothetical protein
MGAIPPIGRGNLVVPDLPNIPSIRSRPPADGYFRPKYPHRAMRGSFGQTSISGGCSMIRRTILILLCAAAMYLSLSADPAQADQRAYGRVWGNAYGRYDWDRFYHYPYVFYPQNFWGSDYYRSAESLYYRYPPEMRIPVYNKKWQNEYPQDRRYHYGHQFILDVF